MTSVRRALAISFIERYALIAISLASNILIARLLSPEEIGLYSVSLAVIGIAQVLRDFGVGGYLIQEKNLTEAHIRTAFGVALIMGLLLFIITLAGASLAVRVYAEPRMLLTLQICSINFLILPFCTVSLAMLRREMLFQKILYVTLSATILGFIATIALAYLEFGANSMAIGTVTTNICSGFGAWIVRKERVILLPALHEWRSVVGFGSKRSAASIAVTISSDITELVAGKLLGFGPVAILSRAQGLMNLFQRDLMAAVHGVAYPAFANAHRQNQDLETHHINSIAIISVFAWPFYGFVSIFSLEILNLLFGPQWDSAAGFVGWYCLAGAVLTPSYLIISLLTATGNITTATKIELITHPLRASFFVIGLIIFPHIETPPILFVIAAAFSSPYAFFMKNKVLPNNWRLLTKNLTKSLIVTAFSLTPTLIFANYEFEILTITFPKLLLASIAAATGWYISLHIIKHQLINETIFLSISKRTLGIFKKKSHKTQ
uniref:Polysaccharide biosynthesis protein n=1 Tax=Dechloromonas aromatica (strain RCB) TaxID=159087 RepID=Q47DD1_DECAR